MHVPGLLGIEVVSAETWAFTPPFPNIQKLGRVSRTTVQLKARVQAPLAGLHVDGKKNISLLRLHNRGEEVRISMGIHNSRVRAVVYPENHVRLLHLTPEAILLWEVAVVTQKENLFLTLQETANIPLKKGIGNILYAEGPQLHKWPQMKKFLENRLGRTVLLMKEENPRTFQPGQVIWYNLAQGLGAIQTEKGAARVRWSQVAPREREDRFSYLKEGERVKLEVHPVVLKPGMRLTSFKWEARRVTLL